MSANEGMRSIAAAVGAGTCSVDMMRGPGGCAQVLEIKTMPARGAQQRVSEVEVTQGGARMGFWRRWRGMQGCRP